MAEPKTKTQTLNPAPELAPGSLPALGRGEKVGQGLGLYAGRVMPSTFGEVMEFAQMMCKGGLSIPKHLRDQPGVCLRVIQQSMAWEMDPWAVASKTYNVNDILAYEAQLVAAVIKKWAPIRERVIPYKFTGEGGELQCSITLHHAETGEAIEYESPKKKDIKPQNSPLWLSDPKQQLGYYTIRALARRHFPEILLGVYDREEVMSMRDVTPEKPAVNFLEDEAAEPHVSLDGEVLTANGKPVAAGDVPAGSTIEVLVVTPETKAKNMLRYIEGETDFNRLKEWRDVVEADFDALPPELFSLVENAYATKYGHLEPL